MGEVKNLRIKGAIKLGFRAIRFAKEVRALSEKEAVEKVVQWLGSKHNLKRFMIKIHEIEEIDPKTFKDPVLLKLALTGEEK